MALAATILAGTAVAGAVAAWIAGAYFFVQTLRAIDGADRAHNTALAIFAWPFATKRLQGAAAEQAARVNKALVAFIVCVMFAAAATSIATNLSRVSS